MFNVAVDKPKYSDSDTKYFLLSSKNNSTLNKKLNRKCIPETVREVSKKTKLSHSKSYWIQVQLLP
jgi:hypothetical protein